MRRIVATLPCDLTIESLIVDESDPMGQVYEVHRDGQVLGEFPTLRDVATFLRAHLPDSYRHLLDEL